MNNGSSNNTITIEEIILDLKKHEYLLNENTEKLSNNERAKLRSECYKAVKLANDGLDLTVSLGPLSKERVYLEDIKAKLQKKMKELGSVISPIIPKTTFDDVKGLEDVKKIVKSFIFIVNNPELRTYYKMNGGLGMLMYGAPGTGKTMFAEAIANELKLPLFVVTPADIFKSEVGGSEEAVKKLFEEMDSYEEGAILFVDECESIFTSRKSNQQDYKAAVTTELLQRINGFGVSGSKRIMIAATNRPEMIDKAYLRYKRFSHIVQIKAPDSLAIKALVESKLKGIKLDGITVDEIANMATARRGYGTFGVTLLGKYSAADICGIIEEASRNALEKMQEMEYPYPIALTKDMFVKAFKRIPPSISVELESEYDDFLKENS